jgi:predicted Ser/Thr protein kinase
MAELPEKIGRYEILQLLGRGAMGMVYKARDPLINRVVAIKVVATSAALPPEAQAEFKERFFREAQAAGNLHHRNIVTIYDVGEEGGVPFMAQEYVDGESLAQHLKKRGMVPLREALAIAKQVSEGLAYAHDQGIIHRDIKPDNILIDSKGRAVITDFGVARLAASDLTRTGEVLGTPTFMSPEQVLSKPLDGRSDLFSLGVMISGQTPFKGETISSVCYHVVHSPPEPPVDELTVPQDVAHLLDKLLAKAKESRYDNAGEAVEAMEEILDRTTALTREELEGAQGNPPAQAATLPVGGTMPSRPAVPTQAVPPPAEPRSPIFYAGVVLGGLLVFIVTLGILVGIVKHLQRGRIEVRRPTLEEAKEPSRGSGKTSAPAEGMRATKGEVQAKPSEQGDPSGKGSSAASPRSGAAAPVRAELSRLSLLVNGPLLRGELKVFADGKLQIQKPFIGGEKRDGRAGFLMIEHLDLSPGAHDLRFSLGASSPGPYFAETHRTFQFTEARELILSVKTLRMPARLQVEAVRVEDIPASLRPYFGAGAKVFDGQEVVIPSQDVRAGAQEGAEVHIVAAGPFERGEITIFVNGEVVSRENIEAFPRSDGMSGFLLQKEVPVSAGDCDLKVVLRATRPGLFLGEGMRLMKIQNGQRIKLRVLPRRFPARLSIEEIPLESSE